MTPQSLYPKRKPVLTELSERSVGKAGVRDSAATMGQCAGGAEPTARLHRLQQFRLVPATAHAAHLADPLESLCVLQPLQGSGPHHRHVPL